MSIILDYLSYLAISEATCLQDIRIKQKETVNSTHTQLD